MDLFRQSMAGKPRNQHGLYQPLAVQEMLKLLSSDSEDDVSKDEKIEEIAVQEGCSQRKSWFPFLSKSKAIRSAAFTVFVAIIPSFLNYFEESKPKKLHKTAWLDGLRGIAALMVVCHHSTILWYHQVNRGWGSSPDDYYLIQLPIIRLICSGSSNVALFFVVSGFSLSYKPLQLIRQGNFPSVLNSLASSVVRRGMRLTMPPAFVMFFSMLATYFDFYGVGPGSRQPPMSPYFWEHLKSWYYSVLGLSDPFRPRLFPGGYNPVYDTNLWTIPVEFYGSMVIFVILLGTSKLRGPYRLAVLFSSTLYLNYYAYSHLFLFISGVLLCEIHHIRQSNLAPAITLPLSPLPTSTTIPSCSDHQRECQHSHLLRFIRSTLWTLYTLLSLFILSMPMFDHGAASSPGYRTLAAFIPPHYRAYYIQDTFWIFFAAVNLVFIIDRLPCLQKIFTTRLAQYAGKISFAIYICHGTILYTLGYRLSGHLRSIFGETRGWHGGYAKSIFLTGCVVYPLLFWISDVVARLVDQKSVLFARWVSDKISVKEE